MAKEALHPIIEGISNYLEMKTTGAFPVDFLNHIKVWFLHFKIKCRDHSDLLEFRILFLACPRYRFIMFLFHHNMNLIFDTISPGLPLALTRLILRQI